MALTDNEQESIEKLARQLIKHYKFNRQPVPVEKVLSSPPEGLNSVDLTDMSLVFGVGEHRYEYRMAMARLLYREVCRASSAGLWGDGEEYPYSNEAARYFAASLLVPVNWVLKATRRPFVSLEQLSEEFQVPEYAMASRLAKLGKRVKGMQ